MTLLSLALFVQALRYQHRDSQVCMNALARTRPASDNNFLKLRYAVLYLLKAVPIR